MDKIQLLRENIFVQIAKLLALSQLKREIPKALSKVDNDPDIQASLESMKYHADRLDMMLKRKCKDYPEECGKKSKS